MYITQVNISCFLCWQLRARAEQLSANARKHCVHSCTVVVLNSRSDNCAHILMLMWLSEREGGEGGQNSQRSHSRCLECRRAFTLQSGPLWARKRSALAAVEDEMLLFHGCTLTCCQSRKL